MALRSATAKSGAALILLTEPGVRTGHRARRGDPISAAAARVQSAAVTRRRQPAISAGSWIGPPPRLGSEGRADPRGIRDGMGGDDDAAAGIAGVGSLLSKLAGNHLPNRLFPRGTSFPCLCPLRRASHRKVNSFDRIFRSRPAYRGRGRPHDHDQPGRLGRDLRRRCCRASRPNLADDARCRAWDRHARPRDHRQPRGVDFLHHSRHLVCRLGHHRRVRWRLPCGQMSGRTVPTTGALHGLTTWAFSTLIVLYLLSTAVGSLVGGAFSGVASLVSGAGQTVAQAAGPMVAKANPLDAIENQVRATGTDPEALNSAAVNALRQLVSARAAAPTRRASRLPRRWRRRADSARSSASAGRSDRAAVPPGGRPGQTGRDRSSG